MILVALAVAVLVAGVALSWTGWVGLMTYGPAVARLDRLLARP